MGVPLMKLLTNFHNPFSNSFRITTRGRRDGRRTARIVSQLPSKNRWVVDVPLDDLGSIAFKGIDDSAIGVEQIMRATWMEVPNIQVHSAY